MKIGELEVGLHRTVRVAKDRLNLLPAHLGYFEVEQVAAHREKCPVGWKETECFAPIWPGEAMWLSFSCREPLAVVICAGRINAVTGAQMEKPMLEKPQNYIVAPPQPWLDGWKAEDGKIYQFAAALLGGGETMEEQLTGKAEFGGLQIAVFSSGQKLQVISKPWEQIWKGDVPSGGVRISSAMAATPDVLSVSTPSHGAAFQMPVSEMGLGRGGEIAQHVYPDPYGLEVWQSKADAVVVIHFVSPASFQAITGRQAHGVPEELKHYEESGKPWFGLHDEVLGDTKGSDEFEKVKMVQGKPGTENW